MQKSRLNFKQLLNWLGSNKDDHVKNFSFLKNHKGAWSLSPAYDIGFSKGSEVAKRWGLEKIAGSFNGEYYGYYSMMRKEIVMARSEENIFLHELSHAAHYRIDPKAPELPSWQKEIIAELSASALLYMLDIEPHIGNHFHYIRIHAEEANLDPLKACMKILDICLAVIEAIMNESKTTQLFEVNAGCALLNCGLLASGSGQRSES